MGTRVVKRSHQNQRQAKERGAKRRHAAHHTVKTRFVLRVKPYVLELGSWMCLCVLRKYVSFPDPAVSKDQQNFTVLVVVFGALQVYVSPRDKTLAIS